MYGYDLISPLIQKLHHHSNSVTGHLLTFNIVLCGQFLYLIISSLHIFFIPLFEEKLLIIHRYVHVYMYIAFFDLLVHVHIKLKSTYYHQYLLHTCTCITVYTLLIGLEFNYLCSLIFSSSVLFMKL